MKGANMSQINGSKTKNGPQKTNQLMGITSITSCIKKEVTEHEKK